MEVYVDSDKCQGHARCNLICPDVFDLDEEGHALLHGHAVPTQFEADVLSAVANCPEQAISTR